MSDMQFEQDNVDEFGSPPAYSNSGITATLIRLGIVSSEQEAQYILVGVAVVALVLAVILVMKSGFL